MPHSSGAAEPPAGRQVAEQAFVTFLKGIDEIDGRWANRITAKDFALATAIETLAAE